MSRPLLAAALALAAVAGRGSAGDGVDFVRDVRPLLSDRCFPCHGPDEAARRGSPRLRLDLREGALAPRDDGAAIVPGDPTRSLLLRRVTDPDPSSAMPPPESHLARLTAAEADVLRRWIDEGAPYATHWAFEAPDPAPPPDVSDEAWPRDDLDRYVLAALEAEGRHPAPEADRSTWLRRVTFDLTGLPPTPSEIDAFLDDDGPDAHARVVDRLLAAPAYGERMASDWLDVARYADTYGYQNDVHRDVWPWRDWVVRAFRDDLPYDEFVTWQLAGDLLPDATRDQRLATTFQRLHRQTNEGGSVEEEMRVESVADRVRTLGTAFLGLTLECARCHDHKFDPISQRDFYRLSAFFNRIDEAGLYSHFTHAVPTPTLPLPTDAEAARVAAAEARVAALEAAGASADRDAPTVQGRYPLDAVVDGTLVNDAAPDAPARTGPENRVVEVDGARAVRLSGDDPLRFPGVGAFRRFDPFTIALRLRVPRAYERAVVFHRSRAWTDAGSRGYELLIVDGRLQAALVHFWPGNAVAVRAVLPLPVDRFVHVAVTWDGSSRADGLAIHVDGAPARTEVVRDHLTRTIVGGGESDLVVGERFRDRGLAGGLVRDLSVVAGVGALAPDEALRDARRERADARDAVFEIMAMEEMAEERPTFVLARGAYDARRERVTAGTPAILPPLRAPEGDGGGDRLALARWLTSDEHPLTARVAVNRLWQVLFGRGLVATAEDFGSQGAPPSHPALLDHLAVTFRASGWDVKALLRRISLSATYRQSSRVPVAERRADPDNLRLARGPSTRLSAEMLRDLALAASGLLVDDVGGPSVRPYQPPGLWEEKSGARYVQSEGDGLYRRSLYTYWKRTSPHPAMMTFDAAKRDVCVARRQTTSSPLQALVLWNDPQLVEAARALAERAWGEADDDAGRIARAFLRLTGRRPSPAEAEALVALLVAQRDAFARDPAAAAALLAVGERAADGSIEPAELAALAVVASVIQSHDAATWKR